MFVSIFYLELFVNAFAFLLKSKKLLQKALSYEANNFSNVAMISTSAFRTQGKSGKNMQFICIRIIKQN